MANWLLVAGLVLASLQCTTRWDAGLQRYLTECRDGSRAISRYDAGLKRWQMEVTQPGTAGARPPGKGGRR